jgi:hypothetical protein
MFYQRGANFKTMEDQRRHKSKRIPHLFLTIALITFGCMSQAPPDQQIIFAQKDFYDSAQTTGEGFVSISGTLSGDGVAYKNNTVAVSCYKDRMECLTNSIEQIGPNQVSRLAQPTSYPITKWDTYEIVATGLVTSMSCRKDTISIVRKSQSAVWVEEPINQSSAACKNADTRLLKFTIEDSPGWKALNANNK